MAAAFGGHPFCIKEESLQCLISIAYSCPYTIVGKEVVQSTRSKRGKTNKMISNLKYQINLEILQGLASIVVEYM